MMTATFDNNLWGSVSDIVTAVAALLGIVGLFLVKRQIEQAKDELQLVKEQIGLTKDELRTEFERYKQTNAFAATASYVNWGPPTLHLARELAEGLNADVCKKIEDGDECNIPFEYKKKAVGCLQEIAALEDLNDSNRVSNNPAGGQLYHLKEREVIHIRWLIVSHLSQLEIALLAWYHKSADEQIIMGQFENFICPPGKKPILHAYREATNGDSYYPALTGFIRCIEKKRAKPAPTGSPAQPRTL